MSALKGLAPDQALLHWFNYQLRMHTSDDTVPHRVYNFSTDVNDGEAWAILLSQVAWNTDSYKVLAAQDTSKRIDLVFQQLQRLEPSPINFCTAEHIASGEPSINMALAARLFHTHSGLEPGKAGAEPLHEEVNELVDTFKSLGVLMRAMKFAAHRWEEAESLEIEMRDFGSTKRKVRGKDIWRGKGVGNGLRSVADVDAAAIDEALDKYVSPSVSFVRATRRVCLVNEHAVCSRQVVQKAASVVGEGGGGAGVVQGRPAGVGVLVVEDYGSRVARVRVEGVAAG